MPEPSRATRLQHLQSVSLACGCTIPSLCCANPAAKACNPSPHWPLVRCPTAALSSQPGLCLCSPWALPPPRTAGTGLCCSLRPRAGGGGWTGVVRPAGSQGGEHVGALPPPSGCFPGSTVRPQWGKGSTPLKTQLFNQVPRCHPGLYCVSSTLFLLDVLLEGSSASNTLAALRREQKAGRGVRLLLTDPPLPVSLAQ